jgi:REP element-mobilizing transposase RayT
MHCVWSTKNREPYLTPPLRERLWPYLGGVAKQNKIKTLAIGGAADHVHVLLSLPATLSIAKATQLLEGNSSKWIHETFPKMRYFAGGLRRISAFPFQEERQLSHTFATRRRITGRDRFARSL